MSDPLANFNFGGNSSGLFLNEFPVKVRVLTIDPVVHMEEKYGTTKYAFVVWNHDLNKAQILDRGTSIAKAIQELHNDEDYGANIQKIDIKISKTGEGKDTRYTITPLPKAVELTNAQVQEAAGIDLMEKIKNGVRLSEAVQRPSHKPMPQSVVTDAAYDDAEIEGEPISLEDIPF